MNKYKPLMDKRRKALAQLADLGNLLEGSLCRADRGDAIRYQLTDKVAGKSRTLYVSADMAEEVRSWTQNWKMAKRLLKTLSDISREEVRQRAGGDAPRHPRKAP